MVYNTPGGSAGPRGRLVPGGQSRRQRIWAEAPGCGSRRRCRSRGWGPRCWRSHARCAWPRCVTCPSRRRCRAPEATGASCGDVLKDLWQVARSRAGFLALLICFLPIGTGAASNLWAAVADDWHASADTVALVDGRPRGRRLRGRLPRRRLSAAIAWTGRSAYALYGTADGGVRRSRWRSRRAREAMYIVFTLVYAFIQGLTYAGFTAVVLEAIGLGAAATKYNVFASLSNMPIAYMTVIDGWAHERVGRCGAPQHRSGIRCRRHPRIPRDRDGDDATATRCFGLETRRADFFRCAGAAWGWRRRGRAR